MLKMKAVCLLSSYLRLVGVIITVASTASALTLTLYSLPAHSDDYRIYWEGYQDPFRLLRRSDHRVVMNSGDQLHIGQAIFSGSEDYYLILQEDGNLVLYDNRGLMSSSGIVRALWHSRTYGRAVERAIMQEDGNFVLYGFNGEPIWHSRTHGHSGAEIAVQNDGNVVIYNQSGQPIWASNTSQY
jgi:hypothetical protein